MDPNFCIKKNRLINTKKKKKSPLDVVVAHIIVVAHIKERGSLKIKIWFQLLYKKTLVLQFIASQVARQIHFYRLLAVLITLQLRVEWYTRLWALNTNPPRNHFTFLRHSCSQIGHAGRRRQTCMGGGAPPATRSELFTPFRPSIDFPWTVTLWGLPFKGNRLSREPGYSSHHIASGGLSTQRPELIPQKVFIKLFLKVNFRTNSSTYPLLILM